jgi:pyruvate/2-oxoglutarate dehydrogenase complex dihydrolipoamide dehydrogenase (E3) component
MIEADKQVGNFEYIFTPIKIGRMTVKNRIETAPCVPFLASIDNDVTPELIEWERLSLEQIDANAKFMDTRTLRRMLQEPKVDIITEVKLEAVKENSVIVTDKNGRKTEILCDTVVLALGVQPREEIVAMFDDIAPEVRVIGDCHNQRGNLYSATSEGFFAAIEL